MLLYHLYLHFPQNQQQQTGVFLSPKTSVFLFHFHSHVFQEQLPPLRQYSLDNFSI